MVTKVNPTPAGEYPLGHAKENKDASAYTGFVYPAGGGNDINVYKQPMNIDIQAEVYEQGTNTNKMNISAGVASKNAYAPVFALSEIFHFSLISIILLMFSLSNSLSNLIYEYIGFSSYFLV